MQPVLPALEVPLQKPQQNPLPRLSHTIVWVSVSPCLKCLDQRLLGQLAAYSPVKYWEYFQTADEPCALNEAIGLLHDYLSSEPAPVHLMGHGMSGIVALLYARRYPEQVASLTLLSVGALPAINWQAHYYGLRRLLPCSREMVLGHMARLMFGPEPARFARALPQLLARDLDGSLTLHSLAKRGQISAGGVDNVPLLVCNGSEDATVGGKRQADWAGCLKAGDRLWQCPQGRHFFHFHQAALVAEAIAYHWQLLKPVAV